MAARRAARRLLGAAVFVVLASALTGIGAAAQGAETFTARLAWVPITGAERVVGKGTATATLTGRTLSVTGSFEGLGGPATIARVHEGVARGARGRAIGDLTVAKTASGAISGSLALTPEQVTALRQGRVYIQVHGEKGLAPDGANLWGWLQK